VPTGIHDSSTSAHLPFREADSMRSAPWTPRDAERYLLALELFGMRFGLDRMRRLMTALGRPQGSFDSIHVVGTNGKSSTVRMIDAILAAHGRRTGAYVSPHLISFAERIRVAGEDAEPESFAQAVQRAAQAASLVDRTAAPDDRVTQFEALTAAAYSELAARDVEIAVIEAGLGGRYDATNVLESKVQVLTNVGLEHTQWLGPRIIDIAREKLAVVRDGSTLVVGGLDPDAQAEAEATAERHGARLVIADSEAPEELGALGAFQRRNFAVARAAAQAYLGRLDPRAVAAAAAEVTVPGRLQPIGEQPLTLVDGAHNPAGVRALTESLLELKGEGRPLVAAISILEDKDAAAMLAALLPHCAAAVFTSSSNPRALSPATLESLARQQGGPVRREWEPDPHRALELARTLAGPDGIALATGSIYLVADLLAPPGGRAASVL
jgi:dihydrofolate synthase/folylpolyglutamate synthase